MKKLLLCLLSLVCVVCLFTACNKDTKYKITFQDLSVLPEGVERIQNGQGTMLSGSGNDATIYFTSGKGGSFFVTVTKQVKGEPVSIRRRIRLYRMVLIILFTVSKLCVIIIVFNRSVL